MAKKTIVLPDTFTVGELATETGISLSQLIGELMKNGIMATVNERIDFETAQIIVEELDLDVELTQQTAEEAEEAQRPKSSDREGTTTRPPIIAVMGHVDHGKTTLLDAIREADTASGESGGITQHISAYQIEHKDRKLTFLDTPGHEAFSALRQHGAQLTDVALIVVAADDGVKPQTKEAIDFAKKAGVKMVVAINKIDKEGVNTDRLKQQLTDLGLQPEDWGGDTVMVEVSAKDKLNIDKLLEMILLVVDIEELTADDKGYAEGIVIEAHVAQGRGAQATLLVEHGQLKVGEAIVTPTAVGKIRTLEDDRGNPIKQAGPSTPVIVTGFKTAPQFGEVFKVMKNEKVAKAHLASQERTADSGKLTMTSSDLLSKINKERSTNQLPVIVKADVQGSLTSVLDALHGLEHEEVNVRVIGSGLGNISENDVRTAATAKADIYGFNVNMSTTVKKVAAREQVVVKLFTVIYELIDDVKEGLSDLLSPEIVETEIGRLVIKGVFRTTKSAIICGGEVTKGKATPNVLARVTRGDEALGEVEVTKVQRGQQEAKEAVAGELCGLELKTESKILLEEGDKLEFFTRESKTRKL